MFEKVSGCLVGLATSMLFASSNSVMASASDPGNAMNRYDGRESQPGISNREKIFRERTVDSEMRIEGSRVNTTWFLPAESARGWVILMHGFARSKGNMRDLASRLQKTGLIVMTPSVSTQQINSASFISALGSEIHGLRAVPRTEIPLPERFVVAGHSIGGKNATILGASLLEKGGHKPSGIFLLDPVERDGKMERALNVLEDEGTEVLSILAKSGSCNSYSNSFPLLMKLSMPFKGVRFNAGSHCDAEGSSSDFLCKIMCGQSNQETVADTLEFSVNWISGFIEGKRDPSYFPGGERYAHALRDDRGSSLELETP